MEWFDKMMHYTLMIGFGALGVLAALCVIRIALEVVGFMLGSTLGTILLGLVVYHWYKRYKNENKE